MTRMGDDELVRRIVDQVERGIRRAGLTGPEGGIEARRRFDAACPWAQLRQDGRKGADPRWAAYWREAERALSRLFSPFAEATAVEVGRGLAVAPELAEWLASRRLVLREREPKAEPDPAPAGGEQTTLAATGPCAACKALGAERIELGHAAGRLVTVLACAACLPRFRAEAPAMLAAIAADAERVRAHTEGAA